MCKSHAGSCWGHATKTEYLSLLPRLAGHGHHTLSDCKWRGRAGCGQSLGFLNRKVSRWDTRVVECRAPGDQKASWAEAWSCVECSIVKNTFLPVVAYDSSTKKDLASSTGETVGSSDH